MGRFNGLWGSGGSSVVVQSCTRACPGALPKGEDFLDNRVESSENVITTNETSPSSKGVEDIHKFDSNVTCTNHDNLFWLVFKGKETISGNAELVPGVS